MAFFTTAMSEDARDPDLLTIRQLKQVAGQQPQPYRIHAQVDTLTQKDTQQGKPYLEFKLTDGTESLTWRVFDGNPLFGGAAALTRGEWIELAAQWVDTGKFGLDPKNVALRALRDEEVHAMLGGDEETRERQGTDYEAISNFASQISDPRLRGVCRLFLEQHGDRFKRAAAARDYHHARRGGLVEHVAQMMRSAAKICEAYPSLNRDLLVAGVLFHDCGKLWENNYAEQSFSMPFNLHGEMVGHIALGLELVNKLWRQLMDSPEAAAWASLDPANELVRVHLLHLIGSHHGEMQFGSPVLPKKPEAIVLHHVDNIDAKLEMFRRGYETSTELGPGIFERVRPLPANIVQPLGKIEPRPEEADSQATDS
jgi:3'-5' exoribonuclease